MDSQEAFFACASLNTELQCAKNSLKEKKPKSCPEKSCSVNHGLTLNLRIALPHCTNTWLMWLAVFFYNL